MQRTIEQRTAPARFQAAPPRFTPRMAIDNDEQQQLEQEDWANCTPLQLQDQQPLPKSIRPESQDFHHRNSRSWKLDFKSGERILIKGHEFVIATTSKRGLILRHTNKPKNQL